MQDSALFVTYYQKNISVPSDSSALYMMADSIAAIRDNGVLRSVEIVGSASPDGSLQLNSQARRRGEAFHNRPRLSRHHAHLRQDDSRELGAAEHHNLGRLVAFRRFDEGDRGDA